MNKRRLLKLADLLEADARKKRGVRFDMSVVAVVEEVPEDGAVKLDCGTQACAMGLAAISGAFKRCGLFYQMGASSRFKEGGWSILTTVNGRARDYDRAAMAIFDLTHEQANFLFDPAYYSEPMREAEGERYVAKRIRDFVAGKVSA